MGRDNHPRTRQKRDLERKKNRRASYDRILIVCEGEKTEPQYFKEIQKFYRLNTANIEITSSEHGTAPQQVVNYAFDKLKNEKKWEHIYCVFDRDDHINFNNAIQSAEAKDRKYKNDLGEPIRFTPIPSNPCFELWLLLHFCAVTRETHRKDVLHELRKKDRLPNYEKGMNGHFQKTRDKLETAFKNSNWLISQHTSSEIRNPYTAVDILVKRLIDLNDH